MSGHLIVQVGGVRRTIPVQAVQEVVRTVAISRVPGSAPSVRGLAAVRGRLVPVVDPGETPAASAGFLVIVAIDGRGVGLMVDRVDGVIEAGAGGAELPPAIELSRYARSVA